MRGEHDPAAGAADHPLGSSPRAWGTRELRRGGQGFGRIIPTCVGNTPRFGASRRATLDHPHVRGEHGHLPKIGDMKLGSSPRAWGTRAPAGGRAARNGIIPTCVGNTVDAPVGMPLPTGSSPRAWGTLNPAARSAACMRIIPTCVGNTGAGPAMWTEISDHPHVRGEHSQRRSQYRNSRGSSPRAWGTRRMS